MAERKRVELHRSYDGSTYIGSIYDWPKKEPEVVGRLRELVAERAKIDGRIAVTVQELRQSGASWSVVGHALGCTRSAAQKRYGRDELAL